MADRDFPDATAEIQPDTVNSIRMHHPEVGITGSRMQAAVSGRMSKLYREAELEKIRLVEEGAIPILTSDL